MVNVKVPYSRDRGWSAFREYDPDADPRFTEEWVEGHVSEETLDAYFWAACEGESEYYEGWVREIFDAPHLVVYAEGRSGGWRVVSGLRPVDEWDAVTLSKWRKVERIGKALADGIPAQTLSLVYLNAFEEWSADRLEDEPSADVPEMLAGLR
jgi:hypothetical protein